VADDDSIVTGVASRNVTLAKTVRSTRGRTAAAKAEARAKREAKRPHKALEESWYEIIYLRHPKGTPGVKWGTPERQLAKACIGESDLDTVLKAIRYFIDEWCPRHEKFPSFKLFWAVRGQIHAEMQGTVKPKLTAGERMERGEWDRSTEPKSPKIGWG